MGAVIGPELETLAAERILVVLGTVRRDGTAQLTPVWFEYAEGAFWINGGANRDWLRHAQQDPSRRITLYLKSDSDDWRWAQIQGRVTDLVEGEEAWEHIERLSRRYTGRQYNRRPGDSRIKVRIEPLRVIGSNGRGRKWDAV